MPDCGVLEFMNGGVIAEAHITSSSITDSRVSASDMTACNLQKLASIDEDSAQLIADAIAALSADKLVALGNAIAAALPNAALANGPQQTTEDSMPATIAGSREVLLGKPQAWLAYKDFVVPGYKEDK